MWIIDSFAHGIYHMSGMTCGHKLYQHGKTYACVDLGLNKINPLWIIESFAHVIYSYHMCGTSWPQVISAW
jgi:hypothetical protein